MITRVAREVFKRSRLTSILSLSPAYASVLHTPLTVKIQRIQDFSVFSKSPDYNIDAQQMDLQTFESLCSGTLESLTDYFEEVVESDPKLGNADVAYSDGVLTIKLGSSHGTYVINRQTPNRQIWLSSPTSGPKRYDYIDDNWIYKHDGMSLHQLLQSELEKIISVDVDFLKIASNKK